MTQRYPLSWPTGWKRTAPERRARAKFTTSREAALGYREKKPLTVAIGMERMASELDRLGATSVLVSSNIQLTTYGTPRSGTAEPQDPGVAVYFVLSGKERVLACDKWHRVADNLAAIAGHIDAIRRQERYGVGTLDQAFAGYDALPAPGQHARRSWRHVLGVPTDYISLDGAEFVYRQLARERHPDAPGGSHELMAELNAAIEDARQELGA